MRDLKKGAYIKDKNWSYEKEYRIVFDKKDETELVCEDNKRYMNVKIVRVYLGANFQNNGKEKQEKVLSLCTRKNIGVKRMILGESDYSIMVFHEGKTR